MRRIVRDIKEDSQTSMRESGVSSQIPVRESERLRPLVAGYTAEECAAQAENAFLRRVPGRRMGYMCLIRHLVTSRRAFWRSYPHCNVVSLQTPVMLSPTGHTNRKNAFAAELRHFPGSCARLLMVEVFQTSAQVRAIHGQYFSDLRAG